MNATAAEVMAEHFEKCEGCGQPVMRSNNPCWECVKARARAAVTRRCSCGKKRRERAVDVGFGAWVSCDRCLGTVRQLPDPPRRPRA